MNFSHKKVFIAGASKGLGLALACAFLKEGAQVAVCARSPKPPNFPDGVHYYQLNVQNQAELDTALKDFANGQLDYCVACAGHYETKEQSENDYGKAHQVYATNFEGTLNTFKHALEIMKKQGSGHLIAISSVAGLFNDYSVYAESKGAIIKLCQLYRQLLSSFPHIHVSCALPGYIDTERLRDLNQNDLSNKLFVMTSEDAAQRIIAGVIRKKSVFILPFRMRLLVNVILLLPKWLRDRVI